MEGRRAADGSLALFGAVLASLVLVLGAATLHRQAQEARSRDALAVGQPGRAAAIARSLVGRDPLDVTALETLGAALQASGDRARAEAVFDFIGRRSRRESLAEARLFETRLAEGRFDEAFAAADALLRRDDDGKLKAAVFPALAAGAEWPEPRGALVRRLGARPPWRNDFLHHLAQSGDPAAAYTVFADLKALGDPADAQAIAPLIDRMVGAGRYDDAMAWWIALAPGGEDRAWLRDGDFREPVEPSMLGWSAARGAGASSAMGPAPGGGPGLRIDWDGFSAVELPRQLLVLAPGAWRLSWSARTLEGSPEGLSWTVRCAGNGAVLGRSPPPSPGDGWKEATLAFAVPAQGCQGQWLELVAAPGERRTENVVWYRRFSLQRG